MIKFSAPELDGYGFNIRTGTVTHQVGPNIWLPLEKRGNYRLNGRWFSHYRLRTVANFSPVDVPYREITPESGTGIAKMILRLVGKISQWILPVNWRKDPVM